MFSDMAKGPRDQPTKCKASFPSLRSPAYVTLKMLHPGRHPAPWGKQSRRYEPSVGALAHSWGLYERWVKLQGLQTEAEGSGRHPEGEAQVGLPGAWLLLPASQPTDKPGTRDMGQGSWEPRDLGGLNSQLCFYSSDPLGKSLLLCETQPFLP